MSNRSPEIAEVHQFTDEQSRQVTQFVPVDKKTGIPNGEPIVYRGIANFEVSSTAGNPGGRITIEFTFPPNTTFSRAFRTFDKVAKKAFETEKERMMKQQKGNQIQVVGAGAIPQLYKGKQ